MGVTIGKDDSIIQRVGMPGLGSTKGGIVESDQTSKNGNYVWWDGETFGVGVVSRGGS